MKKLSILLFVVITCPGCFSPWVYVHSEYPNIHLKKIQQQRVKKYTPWPDDMMSTDEKVRKEVVTAAVERENYIEVLEATITEYNNIADKHNQKMYDAIKGSKKKSLLPWK